MRAIVLFATLVFPAVVSSGAPVAALRLVRPAASLADAAQPQTATLAVLLPHEPNLLHETEEKERSRSHDIDSTPFSPINITYGLVSGVLGLLLHRELSRGKEDREQLKKEQEEAKKRIEELTEKVNAIQSKLMQDLNAVHVILARQEVSMMGRDQRIQALNERLNK